MASLIYIDEYSERIIYSLDEGAVTIGRNPDCQVCIPEESVSSVHATVGFENDGLVLRDSSTNGTYVNGVKVDACVLSHNDMIRVSHYLFMVNLEAVPQQPVEPVPQPPQSPQPVMMTTPRLVAAPVWAPQPQRNVRRAMPLPQARPRGPMPMHMTSQRPVNTSPFSSGAYSHSLNYGSTKIYNPYTGKTEEGKFAGMKKEVLFVVALVILIAIAGYFGYRNITKSDSTSHQIEVKDSFPGIRQ